MDRTRPAPAGLSEAVETAIGELLEDWVSTAQAARVAGILRGFARFCARRHHIDDINDVTPAIACAFIASASAGGIQPSVALTHLRRTALRLLFRAARRLDAAVGDPTLDLQLPARTPLATRPLIDDEVSLCRAASAWSLSDRRRAAAWALAEATCRSVEVAQITGRDIDLAKKRVWIHGGRTTSERWGQLSDWGCLQVGRRLAMLDPDRDRPIIYQGECPPDTGQVSACIAVRDVLIRAGLADESAVRPASVAAWAGRKILSETGQIDEVARRLGMTSLDRTARFIGCS